ncbi:MAG: rod shape-determining protein MreD [Bacteroidia bacterium]|jgi:rod shape-determining protein MreD
MKISTWLRFIITALALVALQVLVLNHLDINEYMFPQVYILVFIVLPVNTSHWPSYLFAFLVGALVDSFTYTPGFNSFACVLLVFIRYAYFKNFVDKELLDSGVSPSFSNTDSGWTMAYVAIFSFLFHFVLFTLESFTFTNFLGTMLKILMSTSLSILLILLLLFVFRSKTQDET